MFKKEDGHIMLDIETLSTSSDAPILQIGFALADEVGIHSGGKITIPLEIIDFQLYPISGDTLRFWLSQKKEAIESVFFPPPDNVLGALADALKELTLFINSALADYPNLTVWANHPQFDIAILANAYETEGVEKPIYPLYKVLDYATMRKLSQVEPRTINLRPHDAEFDCVYQLTHLLDIFDSLEKMKEQAQAFSNNSNPNLH